VDLVRSLGADEVVDYQKQKFEDVLRDRLAKKRGVEYSFLLVNPDGSQLAEIGELLQVRNIRPVIDKVFPFDQAKEALAYLEMGRAKGKVVVQKSA
jgi:NADPH:quinone reductase-like Zn-dependent oxidoreductase